MNEAEGGDLKGRASPLQLRNVRRQWNQVVPKPAIFQMNPGMLGKRLTFEMLAYFKNILGSPKCFSLACILLAGHPLDCVEAAERLVGQLGGVFQGSRRERTPPACPHIL